ncbi:RNA-binding protein [Methanogenium marinum]|uniref:RNA-binding protein n=1 Tax=Methanogenium marinum TaxID=348610 RepID=A0A9Q4KU06_9EURY|nr:RNA-binding protein [Methanogenium marinum]MDE4908806.1 RNA-binding protein [Methanogenium marinum]
MASHKLFVSNIKHSMTTQDLRDLFTGFGEIKGVQIVHGRGFGFVIFATTEQAELAKKSLSGREFEGKTLHIEDAKPFRGN